MIHAGLDRQRCGKEGDDVLRRVVVIARSTRTRQTAIVMRKELPLGEKEEEHHGSGKCVNNSLSPSIAQAKTREEERDMVQSIKRKRNRIAKQINEMHRSRHTSQIMCLEACTAGSVGSGPAFGDHEFLVSRVWRDRPRDIARVPSRGFASSNLSLENQTPTEINE